MKHFAFSLGGLALAITVSPAFANPLTYTGGGQAATVDTYATGTSIELYFDGASAGFTDYVKVLDINTGVTSSLFFDNQTTQVGATHTISGLHAGDQLVFELDSPDGNPLTSDPTYSTDDANHAWIESFLGNVDGPGGNHNGLTGDYVGFEDESPLGYSDLDYNDETFVVTGITTTSPSPTPEPGSLALLGTSILGAAGFMRRRFIA
ncbi:MAG TPA: PEP-CTERM sorting domain-containing protein [Acidobacteriaceae bacterium]|jgi:hypothetical protein